MDEKEVYQKFLDGDMRAFDSIVLNYKNGLIAFISRYVRDIELAEDISQEVFVDFGTSISPCIIRPVEEGGDYIYMVLPIRMKE